MYKGIKIFSDKKGNEKITMLTAYDYSMASFLEEAGVDSILVGDSLGMVFQGHDNTLSVTIEEMLYHTKAVKQGAKNTFVVTDMPFLSYHTSKEETIKNAGLLIKEGGAEAVKLEGGREIVDKIEALISAKIPVLGHLGLTPQSINIFGGFKVQGKGLEDARRIIEDAKILEEAGVFAIVLESIPEQLAKIITESLSIPTIGIGAGRFVDGQILVIHDILGMFKDIVPKFSKVFANVGDEISKGVKSYIDEVKSGKFPDSSNTFTIKPDIIQKLIRGKNI